MTRQFIYFLSDLTMSNSIVFKTEFDRQIKNNKCSSYIDQNAKLNSIMQTSSQTKPKNYKKIKSFISNKLRKFLNQNPDQLQQIKKNKKSQVQLLKFDYKSNFVAIETAEIARKGCSSQLGRTHQLTPIQQQNRTRRYSNGTSSSSSTSSLSSCNSEQYFLITSENNFQNDQQSSLNFTKNFVESSTPVFNKRMANCNRLCDQDKEPFSSFSFCEKDCQRLDETSQLDESTQCQESPVLIESTFNNSSLSNLSDDLIIVQITNAPKENKCKEIATDNNLNIMNKCHNNTSLYQPQWVLGSNFNFGLVNQLYFNSSAYKGLNPSK